jgi:hypothetical protein
MQTLELQVSDNVLERVIHYLQKSFSKDEIKIVNHSHSQNCEDDLSSLNEEIEKGMKSDISPLSHKEIFDNLKSKHIAS